MEIIKPKIKKDEYELEDSDYLLIRALQDLTNAIERLRSVMLK